MCQLILSSYEFMFEILLDIDVKPKLKLLSDVMGTKKLYTLPSHKLAP